MKWVFKAKVCTMQVQHASVMLERDNVQSFSESHFSPSFCTKWTKFFRLSCVPRARGSPVKVFRPSYMRVPGARGRGRLSCFSDIENTHIQYRMLQNRKKKSYEKGVVFLFLVKTAAQRFYRLPTIYV